jgi:hypothetical protein
MKRFVFVGIFGLLAVAIYAQNWTIDGNINLSLYKWDNSFASEDTTSFSLSLKVGRYVTDKLNIGLNAGFGNGTKGTNFTVGPFFKFDFYKFEKVYFDITGGVYYTKYNGTYYWNDSYPENDAKRIVVRLAPSVTYMVNENVDVYWQFAALSYRYDWLTLKDTTIECKVDEIWITALFTNPTFGIRFRF